MLGMNDVGIWLYGPDKNTPADDQKRRAAISAYEDNMRKLATQLQSAGVRLIFITPSIYDQTAVFDRPVSYSGNDGLGICARYVRDLAREFHGTLVEFYTPMCQINREQQKSDPHFTLVGPDRVHPGDVGHFVMAYQFLKAQGAPEYVSKMALDAGQGEVTGETNCSISDLQTGNSGVSFTCLENALPFPVRESAQPALKMVPFIADMNQELLQVGGLRPGRYAVSIDGHAVGVYGSDDLAAGVNLATVTSTPQYQQAAKVMTINQQRHGLEASTLRWIALMEAAFWPKRVDGPVNMAEITPVFQKIADDAKKTSSPVAGWVNDYLRNKPHEAEFRSQADRYAAEMRIAAQPRPHHYVIRREPGE
jgi:hypothetical protein